MKKIKSDQNLENPEITLDQFLHLSRQEIAELVKKEGHPKCVVMMLDGTRRVLKVQPGYHDDSWLYYKDHIRGLIYKSIEVADILFDMGVETVIGPLASFGNLHREKFMPEGLKRLLEPLLDPYPRSVFTKHKVAVSLYGDLEYARSMPGGETIAQYQEELRKISCEPASRHVLIGIGFTTDRETILAAKKAVEFYKKEGRPPTLNEMVVETFGFEVPPIDIFIRTNEVRPSGGLTPLLTHHDTQMYFPVSPGIISLSEDVLRRIFYDYLYSRVLSHGMYEHKPITPEQAEVIRDFYLNSKDNVLGIGRRIGDMWIHKPEEFTKE